MLRNSDTGEDSCSHFAASLVTQNGLSCKLVCYDLSIRDHVILCHSLQITIWNQESNHALGVQSPKLNHAPPENHKPCRAERGHLNGHRLTEFWDVSERLNSFTDDPPAHTQKKEKIGEMKRCTLFSTSSLPGPIRAPTLQVGGYEKKIRDHIGSTSLTSYTLLHTIISGYVKCKYKQT